jgi:hypothetical protein
MAKMKSNNNAKHRGENGESEMAKIIMKRNKKNARQHQ